MFNVAVEYVLLQVLLSTSTPNLSYHADQFQTITALLLDFGNGVFGVLCLPFQSKNCIVCCIKFGRVCLKKGKASECGQM